jgi:Na+:H+ antiporter, NhaA family
MARSIAEIDQRPVRRLIAPFARFTQLESSGSIVLLVAAISALVLANTGLAPTYEKLLEFPVGASAGRFAFNLSLRDWVNDGLMTIFFLVMSLEVKRELLIGELASWRRSLLPVAAALGGVLTPALIYYALNAGGPHVKGWGIPIATDIAFSIAILGVFGKRIPVALKIFLVTLAIVDDIAGVAVIATAYSQHLHFRYLFVAALLFVFCLILNRLGVIRLRIYMMVGIALWWTVHASGVHATLAGVLLALATPSRTFIPPERFLERGKHRLAEFARSVEDAGPRNPEARGHLHMIRAGIELYVSPLERLQAVLHPWVSFVIIPLFALANAGISLNRIHRSAELLPVFWGIFLGLVLGKPIGISLFAWIAVRLRLAELPNGVNWKQLHAVSWLGGIGFTISIFIAGLAFETDQLYTLSRMAIFLGSITAAGIGLLLLAINRQRLTAAEPHPSALKEATQS